MPSMIARASNRREFVRFLAGSPLLGWGGGSAVAQAPSARLPDPMLWAPRDLATLIASPREAMNVFDFEPVARQNVPPAHFGYLVAGVDDEVTLRANREGFLKFQLRPRRLVDVSRIDMSVNILGRKYDTPIFICPTASNRAFHPDGEVAVAKAARVGNHLQMLSTVATTSIEEATAARAAPIWFQLYASPKWEVAEALVKRAERAGCLAIVLTVDDLGGRNQETLAAPAAYRHATMLRLPHTGLGLRCPQAQLRRHRHVWRQHRAGTKHDLGLYQAVARYNWQQARAQGHHVT